MLPPASLLRSTTRPRLSTPLVWFVLLVVALHTLLFGALAVWMQRRDPQPPVRAVISKPVQLVGPVVVPKVPQAVPVLSKPKPPPHPLVPSPALVQPAAPGTAATAFATPAAATPPAATPKAGFHSAPDAVASVATAAMAPSSMTASGSAGASAPAAATVPVQAPVVDGDYTANAALFTRPAASRRLGESGRVVLRVTVGVKGIATQVAVAQSSGFPRLDQAAVQGALRLSYRPATRAGVPLEWTYLLPVDYTEAP